MEIPMSKNTGIDKSSTDSNTSILENLVPQILVNKQIESDSAYTTELAKPITTLLLYIQQRNIFAQSICAKLEKEKATKIKYLA